MMGRLNVSPSFILGVKMSSDDEFMEIIQNSNLSDMSEENLNTLQVKDLHEGLKDVSRALALVSEFLYDFFLSFQADEEQHPALTTNATIYVKDMFMAAAKFCGEFYDNEFVDDEDDDDFYDDDEDGDDDE
jgi:hypothetical protein